MYLLTKAVRKFLWSTALGPKCAKAFWKRISEGPGIVYLYKKESRVFDDLSIDFEDPELNKVLEKDTQRWSVQEEYILQMTDVFVEPERCIVIKSPNQVVAQTAILDSQYPYILPYLWYRRKAVKIEAAILYDGYGSTNYFHHFLNCLNSIHMMEKVSLPKDIPFIINRQSFESKFFQYIYQRSEKVRAINWKVQEKGEWLRVRKLYRLQCIHYDKEPWLKSLSLYDIKPRDSYRRIFLSRDSTKYNRCLNNNSEIEALLKKYGFETLYAENLSIEEQLEVFQTTKFLVALHGAGLVQQVFMNYEEAHIIEILPRDYLLPLYYWQAHTLGVKYYDIVVGGRFDRKKNYFVDKDMLERAVLKMLNEKELRMETQNC